MNSEIHFNFIQKFQNVLNLLEKYAFLVQFILAIISFILNLLHFVIITRKSIRISSINCLMVGVTVCDICRMLTTIYRYLELEDLEYPEW